MSAVSQPSAAAYKGSQRGTIALSGANLTANSTITAVTLAKAACIYGGASTDTDGIGSGGVASTRLSSTTNVVATRGGTGPSGPPVTTVAYEVVEFN